MVERGRRRTTSAVALLVVGALVLAACGSSASDGTASDKTTPPKVALPMVLTWGVAGTDGPVEQTQHSTPTPIAGISGRVVQIATSNSDTYALTSTGEVWAWGVGSKGELGNGTTPTYVAKAVRVEFPSGVTIESLPNPMPFDGGMAIDSNKDAWAWGVNVYHDLCLPDGVIVTKPVEVPLSNVSLATGAGTHSMYDSNGMLYACGANQYGQLGNGTTASAFTPTRVVGLPAGKIKSLESSWAGSGALMESGAYYDWGFNELGQLGDGNTDNSSRPVEVDLSQAAIEVFQGGSGIKNGQTLAILTNRSVWSWGSNHYGQLGTHGTTNSSEPVDVALPGADVPETVSSGGFASYVVTTTGKLLAWGRNDSGQLGTGGGSLPSHQPTTVFTSHPMSEISATAQNVAGLTR